MGKSSDSAGNVKMKSKTGLKSLSQRLTRHKFDSSEYIVLDTGIRRDAVTGRLVRQKPAPRKPKK